MLHTNVPFQTSKNTIVLGMVIFLDLSWRLLLSDMSNHSSSGRIRSSYPAPGGEVHVHSVYIKNATNSVQISLQKVPLNKMLYLCRKSQFLKVVPTATQRKKTLLKFSIICKSLKSVHKKVRQVQEKNSCSQEIKANILKDEKETTKNK